MFCNCCNNCGCGRFQMPQFEIVRPCCFRPRGGVFLIREVRQEPRREENNCGDRWDGCGCGQRNR